MKSQNKLHIILIFFVLLICFSCSKDDDIEPIPFNKETFYYYGDSLINVSINPQMILVSFKEDSYSKNQALNIVKYFPEIDLKNSLIGDHFRIHLFLNDGITENNYLKLLVNLNSMEAIEYASPSFFIDNGVMFLTNKFFIEGTMTENEFENFLEDNSTYFSKADNYSPGNLFIVNKVKNGFEAMVYANEIHKMDNIEFSSPSFSYLLNQSNKK